MPLYFLYFPFIFFLSSTFFLFHHAPGFFCGFRNIFSVFLKFPGLPSRSIICMFFCLPLKSLGVPCREWHRNSLVFWFWSPLHMFSLSFDQRSLHISASPAAPCSSRHTRVLSPSMLPHPHKLCCCCCCCCS